MEVHWRTLKSTKECLKEVGCSGGVDVTVDDVEMMAVNKQINAVIEAVKVDKAGK